MCATRWDDLVTSLLGQGFADFTSGLAKWRVCRALAAENIDDQHRRTTLGPLWILVSYLAFLATFLLIFSRQHEIANYTAFVALGLLVWQYVSEVIIQSVLLFPREESMIRGTTLPLSVYVLRLSMETAARNGYVLLGCIAVVLISGTPLTPMWLWSAVGVLVILFVTPAVITLFAIGGALFPDSSYVVQNLMRFGLFLTPIFWNKSKSDGFRNAVYDLNPITPFVEIVRQPITEGSVPLGALAYCVAVGLGVWVAALLLLGKFRKQIVFVL